MCRSATAGTGFESANGQGTEALFANTAGLAENTRKDALIDLGTGGHCLTPRHCHISAFFLDQFPARTAEQLLDEIGGIHAAPEVGILQDRLLK